MERLRWNRGDGLEVEETEDALSPASKDPDLHGEESQLIDIESRNLLNTSIPVKQ